MRFISYFPGKNFRPRRKLSFEVIEYRDEYISIKSKSLISEFERLIPYPEIHTLQLAKIADQTWLTAGMVTSLAIALYSAVLRLDQEPIIRFLFLAGPLLCMPAFFKKEYWRFFDKDGNFLMLQELTMFNRKKVELALGLVRGKSNGISETRYNMRPPDVEPRYKLSWSDFSNSLGRVLMLFYDDRLLTIETGLTQEIATEIRYTELTERINFEKTEESGWFAVGLLALFGGAYLSWAYYLFFGGIQPFALHLAVVAITSILIVLALLSRFHKIEYAWFFGKNDRPLFPIRLTRANRSEVEEIVRFVKTRAADLSPKPQPPAHADS